MEKRKRIAGWKGLGDCNRCRHQGVCREGCEAHDEFLNRHVKKALLEEHDKRQRELYRADAHGND